MSAAAVAVLRACEQRSVPQPGLALRGVSSPSATAADRDLGAVGVLSPSTTRAKESPRDRSIVIDWVANDFNFRARKAGPSNAPLDLGKLISEVEEADLERPRSVF